MVRKAWTACGYPSGEQLSCAEHGQIVVLSDDEVRNLVRQYCGQDGVDHLDDVENENEDFHIIEASFNLDDEDEDEEE